MVTFTARLSLPFAVKLGFAAAALLSASHVLAASGLPSGASSLTETYNNWTVTCNVQAQGEAKTVLCAMSQQQVDEQRQRALAVELTPVKDGANGILMLPFGLNLNAGAVLQIDDAKADKALGFSTCLPAGCMIPVQFDAAKAEALGKGKNLTVLAQAVGGNEIKLNVPLEGFAAALKRVRELVQ